jgi:hypothetical protein
MSTQTTVVPLLVFEAADCLMAVLAAEVSHLRESESGRLTPSFDLDRYFGEGEADGPWLQWARGTRSAWLRVRRVIDVVPVSLATLTPMPRLLRAQGRTRAFLAAGLRDHEVFLFLDPARLT